MFFHSQVVNTTKFVDSMIGRLYKGLKERSLDDKVNIVMVSDHGRTYHVSVKNHKEYWRDVWTRRSTL